MAKNTGNNYRKGSIDNRTQLPHPSNSSYSIKRNTETGQFMSVKIGDFKGVAHEVDKRRQ